MAESSRNAVVDNATKDSYFLMHIAPTRRKEREDGNRFRGKRGRERQILRKKGEQEKDKDNWRTSRDKGEGREKRGKGIGDRMQGGKSRGSVRKSLRLAKLRNMETPEPISRNRAADIAGGRSRVYANIFPAPQKTGAPLSRLLFRASPIGPYSRSLSLSFLSLFCFLSRTFHAALFFSLSLIVCIKNEVKSR